MSESGSSQGQAAHSDQDERERQLTETVVASFAGTPDERLRTLMTALIRHLQHLEHTGVDYWDREPGAEGKS